MMKSVSVLLLASAIGANAVPQILSGDFPLKQGANCQALPGGVKMGPGVAIKPEDIPSGCSAFEILVGNFTRAARNNDNR
jgi:hypothetical protein